MGQGVLKVGAESLTFEQFPDVDEERLVRLVGVLAERGEIRPGHGPGGYRSESQTVQTRRANFK